ncbi:hypothetical protein KP79_PYT15799 [Mizuhopecten yessoensis]|uniref:G-protein coupled receptors family 1 profile domain-containing protein n=1 Tax=Mizuhopecten yessoensis TaxID=6573 RepID=A0A210QY94_MIZYE|nr:hypothetical protein KP79_PYT15799 [Mizuhopecten yessoensis]
MTRECFPGNSSLRFGMERSGNSRQANHRLDVGGIDMDFFIVNFENTFRYHFEIYIYGYAWPLLTLIIVVLNSIILYIFSKKRMLTKNVTHLIIATICLFDMLTLVIPALAYVYVFDFLGIRTYLPYDVCATWYLLIDISPRLCHNTVILLTVHLAFQRCLSVTYPFKVGRWCTTRRTIAAMFVCFVVSVVPEAVDATMYRQRRVYIYLGDNTTFVACSVEPVTDDVTMTFIPYIFVWVLVFKVIPCILLIVFGAIMIRHVRRAAKVRCYLLHVNRQDDFVKHERAHEHHREVKLTIMIGWVIGTFLVFEVPAAILIVLSVISLVFHVDIICPDDLETTLSLLYIIVITTFISNFVIYYVCCKEFRSYVKDMLTCCRKRSEIEAMHSKLSNTPITVISQTSEDEEMSSTSRGQGHAGDSVNESQTSNSTRTLPNGVHESIVCNMCSLQPERDLNGVTCGSIQDGSTNTNEDSKGNQHVINGSLHHMSSYL